MADEAALLAHPGQVPGRVEIQAVALIEIAEAAVGGSGTILHDRVALRDVGAGILALRPRVAGLPGNSFVYALLERYAQRIVVAPGVVADQVDRGVAGIGAALVGARLRRGNVSRGGIGVAQVGVDL